MLAHPSDPRSSSPPGPPVLLAVAGESSNWSIASTALLAYSTTRIAPRQLSWVSRTGAVLDTIGKPGMVFSPRIAPDQKYVLYAEALQVFRWDLASKSASALTNASVQAYYPVPLPEDRYLVVLDPPAP